MGLAFTDHVVAAVALEDWAVALWAWCGVLPQVGFGGEFGGRGLGVGRSADLEVAMPALGADAAEGEGAAAADLELGRLGGAGGVGGVGGVVTSVVTTAVAVAGGGGGGGSGSDYGFGTVVAEVVRGVVLGHRGVQNFDAITARRLTPLPWTVYGCGVLLERGFLL